MKKTSCVRATFSWPGFPTFAIRTNSSQPRSPTPTSWDFYFFYIQKEEKLCFKTSSNLLINQMALEMKFIQDHLSITKISSQFKDIHFSRAIQRSSLHHFNLISLQKFPVGGAADAQFKICPNYLEWGKALNLSLALIESSPDVQRRKSPEFWIE